MKGSINGSNRREREGAMDQRVVEAVVQSDQPVDIDELLAKFGRMEGNDFVRSAVWRGIGETLRFVDGRKLTLK